MDGTNIDSSIFTVDTSSSPMMSLAIYTDDINKVERYTFEVSVHYSNYVLASTTDSFDVDIQDNCNDIYGNSATSTASSIVIPTQTYTVNG